MTPTTPAKSEISPIADLSYRGYDGPLAPSRALRWGMVSLATFRANRKKWGFWVLAGLVTLSYLVFGVIFYFTHNLTQQAAMAGGMPGLNNRNEYTQTLYSCLNFTNLLVFLAALVIGANSIAADNKANALLVYLSKPITKTDYLLGKWMGVFLLLAAISVLPALLMYLFFLTAYSGDGFLKQNPTLLFRVLGATLVAPALHASLIIGISSWSKSGALAGAIYAGAYFGLSIIVSIIAFAMVINTPRSQRGEDRVVRRSVIVGSASIPGIVQGISQHLYQIEPPQIFVRQRGARRRNRENPQSEPDTGQVRSSVRAPLYYLIPALGVLIAVPLAAAWSKVRAVEVVKG